MSRDVFFLGAGFSKAINPSYPTLNELTAEINQNLNVEKESIYNHFRKEIPISYKNNDYLRLGLENFIIPPTLDKTNLYNASFIKILWRKAFDVLTNAQNVYIIGFSFPPTDLAVRYLFQSALSNNNNNPNIYVINTKDAIDENSVSYLKPRYDEIFNGCNLYYNYCCDNSLDNFIQEIIKPKLNEVANANN